MFNTIGKKPNSLFLSCKKLGGYVIKYLFLILFSLTFVVVGFLSDTPQNIIEGFIQIITGPDVLISDYFAIGGIGASFFNSGMLMLVSTIILYCLKIDIKGISISSVFLMGSFGLFGKNLVNVWPIILGVFLYSKIRKEKFSDHVYVAFFSTSISPIISEIFLITYLPVWIRLILSLIIGIFIGLCVPVVSKHLFQVHKGFSLYNTGFSVGIIGTVVVSLFKVYGYDVKSRLLWHTGSNLYLGIFLSILFISMLIAGYILAGKSFTNMGRIIKHSGQLNTDFVTLEGFGAVLINMSINGFVAMGYVLLVGGDLNGPTIGGILTIVGFGSFGKHFKNIIPIFLGVVIGCATNIWSANNPSLLLAALFGTSLAPIAGHYGWIYGIIAGLLNSAVVLNLSVLHGGMNLYNTGFSSGVVAAFLVPVFDAFKEMRGKKNKD